MSFDPVVVYQIMGFSFVFFCLGLWTMYRIGKISLPKKKYDHTKDYEWSSETLSKSQKILFDTKNKFYYPDIKSFSKDDDPEVKKVHVIKARMHRGVKKDTWKAYLAEKNSWKSIWEFIEKS